MISVLQNKLAKKFKKLISDDNTLNNREKEKLFDTIKRICYEPSCKQIKLRMQIHEVSKLLSDQKHIQAKRGFKGIVRLHDKRNELVRYFSIIKW